MKNVTIVASSTNSVSFIVNTSDVFEKLARCYPDSFVQTTNEVQTISGVNFRSFENICWRNNVSIVDGR